MQLFSKRGEGMRAAARAPSFRLPSTPSRTLASATPHQVDARSRSPP